MSFDKLAGSVPVFVGGSVFKGVNFEYHSSALKDRKQEQPTSLSTSSIAITAGGDVADHDRTATGFVVRLFGDVCRGVPILVNRIVVGNPLFLEQRDEGVSPGVSSSSE